MFTKAKPVWAENKENEVNFTLQFKALCPALPNTQIHIATSGLYNLWVNGHFAAFGPARAGKNHFRLDRIDISKLLDREENVVIIEVTGYNAYSFEIQKQPSFLQAEILSGDAVLAWTGRDFTARVHPFRRRKTQRYSFQRVLSEAYNITYHDTFLTDLQPGSQFLAETEEKIIIPRLAPYPRYEESAALPQWAGAISPITPEKLRHDRAWLNVSDEKLTGWPIEELEVYPTGECQYFAFTPTDLAPTGHLPQNSYALYRLPYNMTGQVTFRVTCQTPVTLYLMFDEVLTDGKIDFLRMECANAIRWDLCPGTHELRTFNVYTMQYLQIAAIGGECSVSAPVMVQYKHPPVTATYSPSSAAVERITDAAIETYRQNAVDLFTDCPSRERAGWLCDSFFTSRVEYLLTKNSPVETSFLENFLHEEHYATLPEGIFPMCYPADHMDHVFIPQWTLWLILELREYRDRGGSRELLRRYEPRIKNLLGYFRKFENSDGLLEKLDSWNFVEWSMANQLTQDVNYPTNMLYSAALRAAADLYGDASLLQKADRVMAAVREQSFDGEFFVDNAIRRDGKLIPTGQRTEVCQYYAFFFGAATKESHPELLKILVEDFGPERKNTGAWPQIHPANAFIGNYLRLDILMQQGYYDKVRENIEGYFLYMAEKTGTLWENIGDTASCNHGFASYVLCWLDKLEN